VKHVIQFFHKHNQDIDLLLMNLGIDVNDKRLQIDLRVFEMLLNDINIFFSSTATAFKLGASFPAWKLDLIGLKICSRETILDVLTEFRLYFQGLGSLSSTIDIKESDVTLTLKNLETWGQANSLQFYAGFIVETLNQLTMGPVVIESITTAKKISHNLEGIGFKATKVNEEVFSITISKKICDQKNLFFSPKIKKDIDSIVLDLGEQSLSDYERIVRISEYLIKTTDLSLEALEKQIGFSRRKIQFILAENNLTYRDLKDSLRKDLCRNLMLDEKKDISFIYQKLGFANQSSFSTTFKKWFGVSPKKFIQSNSSYRIE
jgi:AraC-like DNA-binding protein